MKADRFYDIMIPLGRAMVVKIIPSAEACPFCGGHTWAVFSLSQRRLRPASGSCALVDVPNTNATVMLSRGDSVEIDECVKCKAVTST